MIQFDLHLYIFELDEKNTLELEMVINPKVGVYVPIRRISGFPTKGWVTIPNIKSLDPGSHMVCLPPHLGSFGPVNAGKCRPVQLSVGRVF